MKVHIQVGRHEERRLVDVEILSVGDGKVSEIRMDRGEILKTRLATDTERQAALPFTI